MLREGTRESPYISGGVRDKNFRIDPQYSKANDTDWRVPNSSAHHVSLRLLRDERLYCTWGLQN